MMGSRSQFGLFVVALALTLLAVVVPVQAQDGGMQMQLLLPLPNNPISTSAFPVAVQFVNPIDAQINHYETTIDGRRFIKGDVNLAKAQPGQSYSFRIDGDLSVYTPMLEPGTHVFNIRLSDTRGRYAERQVSFYLQNTIAPKKVTPPTVRIISPTNGAEIVGPVNIKVEASGDAGIKYITVYVNNVPYGITSEYPYTISWDPIKAKLTPGEYVLSASALDISDNRAVSPVVAVRVGHDPSQRVETFLNNLYPSTKSINLNDYLGLSHPTMLGSVNDMPFASRADYGVPMLAYGLSARPKMYTPGILQDLIALVPVSNKSLNNVFASSSPLRAYGLTTPMALAYKGNSLAPLNTYTSYTPMRNPIIVPAVGYNAYSPAQLTVGAPVDAMNPMLGREFPTYTTLPKEIVNKVSPALATTPVLNAAIANGGTTIGSTNPLGMVMATTMPNINLNDTPAHQLLTSGSPQNNALMVNLTEQPVAGLPGNVAIVAGAVNSRPISPDEKVLPILMASIKVGNNYSGSNYAVPMSPAVATASTNVGTPQYNSTMTILAVTPGSKMPAHNAVISDVANARTINPNVPKTPQAYSTVGAGNIKSETSFGVPASPNTPGVAERTIIAPVQGMFAAPRRQTGNGEVNNYAAYTSTTRTHEITPGQPGHNEVAGYAKAGTSFSRPAWLSLASLPSVSAANMSIDYPGISSYSELPRSYQANDTEAASYFTTIIASVPVATNIDVTPIGSNISAQSSYIIRQGDSINSIAEAYHSSPVELQQLNPGIQFVPEKEIIVPLANGRIYLDNKPVIASGAYYPSPYVVNDVAMVPMRMLIEAKGGVVVWLEKNQAVNAWANGSFVDVQIESAQAKVNSDIIDLKRPAHIVGNRTMVPLSFLAKTLNMEATYNTTSGTYALISKK